MSIQRWHDDGRCFRDPEGEWVTYADHVAEVERLDEAWVRLDFERVEQAKRIWVEAMRAACIAAVEAIPASGGFTNPDGVFEEVTRASVLAALREVQP